MLYKLYCIKASSVLSIIRGLQATVVFEVDDVIIEWQFSQPVQAPILGQLSSQTANHPGLRAIVFDIRWYLFHGRVEAVTKNSFRTLRLIELIVSTFALTIGAIIAFDSIQHRVS